MEGPLILWNRGDDMHHGGNKPLPPMQRYLLCCAILLISGTLAAQETICVTGTVRDSQTEDPLPGVTVLVPGTPAATVTDAGGRFTLLKIKAEKRYELKFQYIGYNTISKTYRMKDTVLNVSLEARAFQLSECGPFRAGTILDTVLKVSLEESLNRLQELVVKGRGPVRCSIVLDCRDIAKPVPQKLPDRDTVPNASQEIGGYTLHEVQVMGYQKVICRRISINYHPVSVIPEPQLQPLSCEE